MSLLTLFAADLVAIAILVFGLYFPRHRRKDLVVAFLAINIGVLAVTQALASVSISAGLGLGLFGVLSIIRLRSREMEQSEVAYYFAALVLGLLGGFPVDPMWLNIALMGALVAVIAVADHPGLFRRYDAQEIKLDRAFTDEAALTAHLEQLLDAKVHKIGAVRADLVADTTVVDVRFERGQRTFAADATPLDLEASR